jgi:hypothetical protein
MPRTIETKLQGIYVNLLYGSTVYLLGQNIRLR